MSQTQTALRSVVLSMALIATSLCARAQIVEPPHPVHAAARLAAGTLVTPKAAVAAANVKDVDQPARAPFQASVALNINNFTYTPVPIPAGQRLVIEYVSISGAAQSSGGGVQPIALLSVGTAGTAATWYFATTPSSTVPTQVFHTEGTAIYADTLQVGPAYSGFTPSFMVMNVNISGHLVSIP